MSFFLFIKNSERRLISDEGGIKNVKTNDIPDWTKLRKQ